MRETILQSFLQIFFANFLAIILPFPPPVSRHLDFVYTVSESVRSNPAILPDPRRTTGGAHQLPSARETDLRA